MKDLWRRPDPLLDDSPAGFGLVLLKILGVAIIGTGLALSLMSLGGCAPKKRSWVVMPDGSIRCREARGGVIVCEKCRDQEGRFARCP